MTDETLEANSTAAVLADPLSRPAIDCAGSVRTPSAQGSEQS